MFIPDDVFKHILSYCGLTYKQKARQAKNICLKELIIWKKKWIGNTRYLLDYDGMFLPWYRQDILLELARLPFYRYFIIYHRLIQIEI